jgi:hypothetical protein
LEPVLYVLAGALSSLAAMENNSEKGSGEVDADTSAT